MHTQWSILYWSVCSEYTYYVVYTLANQSFFIHFKDGCPLTYHHQCPVSRPLPFLKMLNTWKLGMAWHNTPLWHAFGNVIHTGCWHHPYTVIVTILETQIWQTPIYMSTNSIIFLDYPTTQSPHTHKSSVSYGGWDAPGVPITSSRFLLTQVPHLVMSKAIQLCMKHPINHMLATSEKFTSHQLHLQSIAAHRNFSTCSTSKNVMCVDSCSWFKQRPPPPTPFSVLIKVYRCVDTCKVLGLWWMQLWWVRCAESKEVTSPIQLQY